MRFRSKVLLILVLVAMVSTGIGVWIVYQKTRTLLSQEIRSKVLSIAATAAVVIDGDKHEQIRTRQDETKPTYQELVAILRKIRDANRRNDVYVRFAYTLREKQDAKKSQTFALDAEESGKDRSHVGDPYESVSKEPTGFDQPRVDRGYTVDRWGQWLSASAPVRTKEGRSVAAVGIDIKASQVEEQLLQVLLFALIGFALAVCLAVAVGFWIAHRVNQPLQVLQHSVAQIGAGHFDIRVPLQTNDEFAELGRAVEKMAHGLKERDMLVTSFARYVSSDVVGQLLASGVPPSVAGQRHDVTVMFSDIRGFTKISEQLPPEEVVNLLNEYFEAMIEVIFRHHGTLDKFIGDGLMVLFGAPVADPQHAEHAVCAAIEMQETLGRLRQKWSTENKIPLEIGIGIHSGPAIVGNVGSQQRLEYTAIGDTVNLAARLESATKELKVSILMSHATYERMGDVIPVQPQGEITVKGRSTPVTVYAVGSSIGIV